MSRVRFYVKTFSAAGIYATDFVEITDDVLNVNKVKIDLDNNDFDIGIFKNTNMTLTVRNDHGHYSDSDTLQSIFPVQRDESIVRITWDVRNHDNIAGFFTVPTIVGVEQTVFEGLLSDVSQSSSIDRQDVKFTVLGFESIFDRVDVPFASINDGDLASVALLAILNQSKITNLLTVSGGNINPGQDEAIDAVASLENKTATDALEDILRITNSILYITSQTVHIANRDESASTEHTFFGQAASAGLEDIIDISKYRDGKHRLFNSWTWKDTALVSNDATSITANGVRKKEIDSDLYTNTAKRQALLDSGKNEFSSKKREFVLVAPMNVDTIALELLDKVAVDYPIIYVSADSNPMPLYGRAIYGQARLPIGQFSLEIESTATFKILSKILDLKKNTIKFELRETG